MSRYPRHPVAVALGALLLVAACDRPDDQRTGTVTDRDVRAAREAVDPGALAALDSGNAAYRARRYNDALRHYQRAVEREEGLAAGWFGLYMANLALGHADAAEAAMAQARLRASGASLIRPDPAEPLPADHPAFRPER